MTHTQIYGAKYASVLVNGPASVVRLDGCNIIACEGMMGAGAAVGFAGNGAVTLASPSSLPALLVQEAMAPALEAAAAPTLAQAARYVKDGSVSAVQVVSEGGSDQGLLTYRT